jgi:hypothetical protein
MPWNALNTIKNKKPAGGGGTITLAFDNMTGVTTNTVAGWTVYTISSNTALNKTITATTTGTPTINILVAGGGGGAMGEYGGGGWYSGCGGGGRLIQISKTLNSTTPTQTFSCTLPAKSTGAVHGGTTALTFSDTLVGNISCGGGAYGHKFGISALANGGSGAGGAGAYDSYNGGSGVFGGNGGAGSYSFGRGYGGGGGGAGGNGGDATVNSNGNPGPGLPATLDGIKSVYTSGYTFCSGGGPSVGSTYGGGAQGGSQGATTGNPGVIIIAVPT